MTFEYINDGMFEQISTTEMASIQGGIIGGTFCCNLYATATGTACHIDNCTDCSDVDSATS